MILQDIVQSVLERDDYRCIAPQLDGQAGWCHDKWGSVITRWPNYLDPNKLTIAHIKERGGQAMGVKAKDDPEHLVLLCWGHHEGNGEKAGECWGTKACNLERMRRYLEGQHHHHSEPHSRRRVMT